MYPKAFLFLFVFFFKTIIYIDLKMIVNGLKDESNVREVDKILFVYLENAGLD